LSKNKETGLFWLHVVIAGIVVVKTIFLICGLTP